MKVAIISNFFPPDFVGGAEIYAYRLARELVKNNIEVHVITSTTGNEIIEKLDGMTVHRLTKRPPFSKTFGKITSKIYGYNFNPYSYRIKSVLQKIDPDIIHLHNISATIMLYPLINYLNVPTVAHIHDHWPICYKGTLYDQKKLEFCMGHCVKCAFPFGLRTIGFLNLMIRNKLLNKFEKRVDCFITPSYYLKKTLVDLGYTKEEKIMHIPLGIDTHEFKIGSTEKNYNIPTILFVGRVEKYKNPSLIVKILPRILTQVECMYKIIGDGDELKSIEIISNKSGIANNVKMLGKLSPDQVVFEMQRADVTVIPSILNENSPVVIYESLASGTPVIVTNRGGAKELVEDGATGYVIDPDDEDKWVKNIVRVLSDEKLRKTMSLNARKKAEREFDIQNQVKKVIDVYESILS